MSLEALFHRWVKSKLSYTLFFLSWLYALVLLIKKVFKPKVFKRPEIFVISIGNLDFGGSGKTPTTLKVLENIDSKTSCVITRGYKSELEHKGSSFANLFKDDPNAAAIMGDEPFMMLEKFPDCLFFVGKDRKASLEKALHEKCKVAILDDGAQVQSIHKDFSIILCDPKEPIKPLFPVGYRRDLICPLNQADLVIISYCQDQAAYQSAVKKISPYFRGLTCGFFAKISLKTSEKQIAVLAAIARPERFIEQLRLNGYEILDSLILDDHQTIKESMLQDFYNRALKHGVKAFICTEKDFVKLPSEYKKIFIQAKLEFEPRFDAPNWESFVGKIRKISYYGG
jgi:tetraacyldisaccharide 4'-kinase